MRETVTEAARRLAEDGPNTLPTDAERGFFHQLWDIVREPMRLLPVGAGVLYLLLAGCGGGDVAPTPGPLLADGQVVCELVDGRSACSTITQGHYTTQEAVDADSLTSLSMSGSLVCGIDNDGAIQCGGFEKNGILDEPIGAFSAVSAGNSHACAVDLDGAPRCWGATYCNALDAPVGVHLSSLVAGDNRTCGLDSATGRWNCWGFDQYYLARDGVVLDVPEEGTTLRSTSMHGLDLFGVRTDGTIGRWGWPADAPYAVRDYGTWELPAGAGYTKVDIGTWHVCALHESGRLDCWGDNSFGQREVPEGRWSDFAAGETFTCARGEEDARIRCWGCGGTCEREWPPLP